MSDTELFEVFQNLTKVANDLIANQRELIDNQADEIKRLKEGYSQNINEARDLEDERDELRKQAKNWRSIAEEEARNVEAYRRRDKAHVKRIGDLRAELEEARSTNRYIMEENKQLKRDLYDGSLSSWFKRLFSPPKRQEVAFSVWTKEKLAEFNISAETMVQFFGGQVDPAGSWILPRHLNPEPIIKYSPRMEAVTPEEAKSIKLHRDNG